jgi:hypothetical protein
MSELVCAMPGAGGKFLTHLLEKYHKIEPKTIYDPDNNEYITLCKPYKVSSEYPIARMHAHTMNGIQDAKSYMANYDTIYNVVVSDSDLDYVLLLAAYKNVVNKTYKDYNIPSYIRDYMDNNDLMDLSLYSQYCIDIKSNNPVGTPVSPLFYKYFIEYYNGDLDVSHFKKTMKDYINVYMNGVCKDQHIPKNLVGNKTTINLDYGDLIINQMQTNTIFDQYKNEMKFYNDCNMRHLHAFTQYYNL